MKSYPTDAASVVISVQSDQERRPLLRENLREGEHTLADFVRGAPMALAMFDRDMCYVAVSRPWTQVFATGESERVGRSHYDVFPELPERWHEAHRQAQQGERLSVAAAPWYRPDGTISWHRFELSPWRDASGEIGGVVLFIENVTTPKAIDEVLRLLSVDAPGEEFNTFATIATRRLAQILGVDMVQLAVPCADDPASAEAVAVFADGEAAPSYRYTLKGTPCDTAIQRRVCLYPQGVSPLFPEDTTLAERGIESYAGSVLPDSRGRMLGVLSVMSRTPFPDAELVRAVVSLAGVGIGGRLQSHHARMALEASERFSRVLLDTVNSHIAVLDGAGVIIFANEAWFDFVRNRGDSAGAMGIGANYLQACEASADADPEAAEALRLLRGVLSGQCDEGVFEYTCPTPEGTRWYRCTFKRFVDQDQTMVLVASENVSDIKQATRRSQEVETKFRQLFESAPDASLIIGSDGIIRMANRQAELLYKYPYGTLTGQPMQALIRKDDQTDPTEVMGDFVSRLWSAPKGTVWGTVQGTRRDGTDFPADVSVSRFVEEDETSYIVAVRDASQRAEAEADRLARRTAEQANQAKSLFLATMSHEIRTPLNAVLGFAEVLSHSSLDDDQNALLQHMRGSAQHLLGLIDNVLDLSKIEAGEMALDPEAFDLPAMILETARALSGYALQRDVRISLFIDPAVPVRVVSDPSRLRQVVYNLLGNAIKFSGGSGPARVHLRAEMAGGDTPALQLTVRDTGIGMNEAVRARLFQPFMQGESAITRRYGGTGLGLAITKRIVERLGGEIMVESVPGKGSTFRVILRLEAEQEQPAPTPPRLKGLHCLLAASETYRTGDLQRYLEHEKARVSRVDGDVPLSDLLAGRAAVVISGPDFGPDFAPDAAALHGTPRVVLCDAAAAGAGPSGIGTIEGGPLAGATCLRTELLTADALAVAVQRAFNLHVAPEPAPDRAGGPAGGVTRFHADRFRPILVVEDDPMNQKVILRQLAMLGLEPDLAGNGAEALEMWPAKPYGLILADLHMPVMDGYAMTAAIRAREAAAQGSPGAVDAPGDPVSIVALTANVLRDEIGRTRDAGFDGFLTKPMTLMQLAETLTSYLKPLDGRP